MPQLPDTLTWPQWLATSMDAAGLTPDSLARQLGCGTRSVQRWLEPGLQRPPGTKHVLLASLLGVPDWQISLRLKRERDAHAQGSTQPVSA